MYLCTSLIKRVSEPQNAKNPVNTRYNLRTQKQNLVTKFQVEHFKMLVLVGIRWEERAQGSWGLISYGKKTILHTCARTHTPHDNRTVDSGVVLVGGIWATQLQGVCAHTVFSSLFQMTMVLKWETC